MNNTPGCTFLVYRHDIGSDEPFLYLSVSRDLRTALIQVITDANNIDGWEAEAAIWQINATAIDQDEYYIAPGETHEYPLTDILEEEGQPWPEIQWGIVAVHDCDQH